MPEPVVQVEGRKELVASMKAAGVALTDLNKANLAAAQVVSPVAAGRAPRRSGRLAASGRPAGTRAAALIRFGGAAVPYAGPVHFGWPGRNIAPQPFAVEAAHSTEPQWTEVYRAAVDDIIEKVKGV
jgi:hypothetical protein